MSDTFFIDRIQLSSFTSFISEVSDISYNADIKKPPKLFTSLGGLMKKPNKLFCCCR